MASLSPDGARVAYTSRERDDLFIVVVAVDAPEQATARIKIADRSHSEPRLMPGASRLGDRIYPIGRVQWMGWTSPTRLAVATNRAVGPKSIGEIYAFNFDGTNARSLYAARSKEYLDVRSIHPGNPHELVVQVWRDEFIALNLLDGRHRKLGAAELKSIETLNKEREHRIRTFELECREHLTRLLPGHKFTFGPDDALQRRALVRAQSVADPGGFMVYEPATHRLWDFVRRAGPSQRAEDFHTEQFSFTRPDGRIFSGFLTLPQNPHIHKAPLVLFVPEKLGAKLTRDYWPEIHAFAAMGFAVAAIDGRYASNDLAPDRKLSPDDELRHQIEAIDLLAEHYPVSRRNVALFGQRAAARRGFQFVAAQPERFRCLVALHPDSLYPDWESLRAGYQKSPRPPLAAALILSAKHPEPLNEFDLRAARALGGGAPPRSGIFDPILQQAAGELRHRGTVVCLQELHPGFLSGAPEPRAAAFVEIEAFLNAHLYRYSVELGEIEVVGSDVPLPQR